jgi:hypothetical protein
MKSIAAYAHSKTAAGLLSAFLLTACTGLSPSVGISFPIGGMGSVGVSVGADGRVGGAVGVGMGGASVSVGTSGQLPSGSKTEVPAAKADVPADKTGSPTTKTDTPLAKPAP